MTHLRGLSGRLRRLRGPCRHFFAGGCRSARGGVSPWPTREPRDPTKRPSPCLVLRRAHEEHLESRKSQRLADRNPISSWGGAREKGLLMTGIAEASALVSKTGGSRFESWVPRYRRACRPG